MIQDKKTKLIMILSGVGVGILNGLFGGGGGMLAVPVMTGLLRKPVKTAHATAILVILPVTVISAVTYLILVNFEWATGGSTAVGIAVGGGIGALLMGKINPKILGIAFSVLMLFAGIRSAFF